ncbi:transcriptional regulator, TetR family [Streptomyces sp. 1222.5]|uniref:TetR/AcrR family transcriptional regulator n=1 Tax=unclassified Streptomyces TaxID=2593676 RepID=UPI000897BECD|nr:MULTISPECIES: TetR/AcrR family transcriptional regulator [unclassified Streptomyces]PKW00270.1 TetR family transcriptional regulator [Streptomyces sp. 5112.2]SED84567.1 transcriptional regulator, TetR family [Streptomyces sp. 1222.5]
MEAATQVFMEKGYAGTSMDDIAKPAAVSKQTVYKHFANKKKLFAEIVLATTDQTDAVIEPAADAPTDAASLDENHNRLARRFVGTLTQPQVLQLRRLITANAEAFPELGTAWYTQNVQRVLDTLAATFARLSDQRLLRVDDPLLAANHFAGHRLTPAHRDRPRPLHNRRRPHVPRRLPLSATAPPTALWRAVRFTPGSAGGGRVE